MITYEKETKCGYSELLRYVANNKDGTYTITINNETFSAKYYLMYEDENGLELDDPNYEEYNTILFKKEDGSFIEINYLNLPYEIYRDGVLVFKMHWC